MLWRESYTPIVSRDPIVTSFGGQTIPLIGSASLESGREVEIWWRLFEEDFPGEVSEIMPSSVAGEALSLRPPSRHPRIRFDDLGVKLLEGYDTTRAFCAIVESGTARIVVVGPPTEEVWDEVAALWRSIRT